MGLEIKKKNEGVKKPKLSTKELEELERKKDKGRLTYKPRITLLPVTVRKKKGKGKTRDERIKELNREIAILDGAGASPSQDIGNIRDIAEEYHQVKGDTPKRKKPYTDPARKVEKFTAKGGYIKKYAKGGGVRKARY